MSVMQDIKAHNATSRIPAHKEKIKKTDEVNCQVLQLCILYNANLRPVSFSKGHARGIVIVAYVEFKIAPRSDCKGYRSLC